jgi:hypothetical protein
MKILVFTEGTIFTHRAWLGLAREEAIRRIKAGEILDYAGTLPIGNAAEKIQTWKRLGAEIVYLTSRRGAEKVGQVREMLIRFDFPAGELLSRQAGEEYSTVAERAMPDVIVEDNCESIGGEIEMTWPHIRADIREKIRSIVVKEFGGIDHLPDDLSELALY